MPYQRDPVSVRFDLAARSFLAEAYEAAPGWAVRFLPPPGPKAMAWMRSQGVEPYERDRWGELRWIRAYKRACYWQLKNYGGAYGLRETPRTSGTWPGRLEWETGVRAERPEWDAPRWAVRIRIHPPGAATSRIGREKSARRGDNWIDADGHPNFRQSTPDDRDY